MEEELHQIMNQVHKPLLRLIRSPLSIHPCNSNSIFGANDPHLLDLLIELLIGDQVGSLRITEIGLFLEFIPLGRKLGKLPFLLVDHGFRPLHHGRQDGIHRSKDHRREEHNTEAQDKGTKKRIDIHRLSSR